MYEIIVTDQLGQDRRYFPMSRVENTSYNIERYGGYGDFTITFVSGTDFSELDDIRQTDRVDFFNDGVRRFRGYVSGRKLNSTEPHRIELTGYGRSISVKKQLVDRNYVFPNEGADISDGFATVMHDVIIPKAIAPVTTTIGGSPVTITPPYLKATMTRLGVPITQLQGVDKVSGDVIDSLVSAAGNVGCWGTYVDDADNDTATMYPISSAIDHSIFYPSKKVETFNFEEQSADIVNSLVIIGGPNVYPQLLHNGDWQSPTLSIGDGTNYVLNGGFELGGFHVATSWSLSGGATPESGKSGSSGTLPGPNAGDTVRAYGYASAFEGRRYMEFSAIGEGCEQVNTGLTFVTGHNYVFSYRSNKEIASQTMSGTVILELKDSGGSVVKTLTQTEVAEADIWSLRQVSFVMPAGITAYRISFVLDALSAVVGGTGGWIVDDVALYDNDVASQDGWSTLVQSSTSLDAYNWTYQGKTLTGAYSVYLAMTATDADNHDLLLKTPSDNPCKVSAGKQYRLKIAYCSPLESLTSPPTTPHTYIPKFQLQVLFNRGDGSFIGIAHPAITPPTSTTTYSDWQYAEVVVAAPNEAVNAEIRIAFRDTGSIVIGYMSFTDAAADASIDEKYIAEGNYRYVVRCDDSRLADVADYESSIARFGVRAVYEQADIVNNDAQMLLYSNYRFLDSAMPYNRVNVVTNETFDNVVYRPGDKVRVTGKIGGDVLTTALPIIRVAEKWDGQLKVSLELSKEMPTLEVVMKRLVDLNLSRSGAVQSSGSGSYGNPSTSGSSSSAATAYRETLTASPSDTTLHDDYRTGPHIADAERIAWDDVVTEVTDARDGSVTGSHATLDARLEDIEAALSGITTDVTGETPSGAINGTNTTFVLANAPLSTSLAVYLNGSRQALTVDYALSSATITFTVAPPALSTVLCDYRY